MINEDIIKQLMDDPEGRKIIENLIINQNVSIRGNSCNSGSDRCHHHHHHHHNNNCNDDFDLGILLLLLFCGCGFGFFF